MTINARRILCSIISILALSLMFSATCLAAKTQSNTAKPTVKITAAQANAKVLKRFPGTIQGTTKLENEEGVWQYGVLVLSNKTLREVMVNAKTGRIDSVEATTAAKEGVEEKADAASEKGDAGEKGEAPETK